VYSYLHSVIVKFLKSEEKKYVKMKCGKKEREERA